MAQFSAAFDLSSLDGSNGFRLDGVAPSYAAGISVGSAGDVNGDGFDDVLIGSHRASPGGDLRAGETYVVFGVASGFAAAFDLVTLDGSNGFRLAGIDVNDYSGHFTSSAGDVNGDGFDDILIGADAADPGGNSKAGESYVVFGKAAGFAGSLDLSTLDGANGYRLDGINADDHAGASVSSAGDINGDGYDDVIIGAYGADPGGNSLAGESYVVFGKAGGFADLDLSTLDGTNGFTLQGIDSVDTAGFSVSDAGDVNGDGFDDVIVGAFHGDVGAYNDAGESYVVFGKAAGFAASISLATLDGSNGFRLDGISGGDHSGWSVSTASDLNGDGYADIIIGADHGDPGGRRNAGESYVVFGQAGGFAASIDLSTLDGTNGFALNGKGFYDYSGRTVSSAGDVNGDGFDDLLVGAPEASPYGRTFAGESYVVFGKAGGFAASLELTGLDGNNGFRLEGLANSDLSGVAIGAAGDVNGDGFDDFLIGAAYADPDGVANSGESYLVFGVKETAVALNLVGAAGDQTMLGGTQGDTISGLGGDDFIKGFAGADTLNGDDGNDTLIGGRGIDTENGGTGDDRLYGATGNDILNGGDGSDMLKGNDHDDTLNGDRGDDLLFGGAGNDTQNGGTGSDRLFGGGGDDLLNGNRGNDRLRGEDGDDVLQGLRNNDHLKGGAGNDTLDGGTGKDWLFGGTGADTFVFAAAYGTDSIHDWEDGIDLIDLTTFGFADFDTDVKAHAAEVGANLVITLGLDVLTINNFALADFDAGDVLL